MNFPTIMTMSASQAQSLQSLRERAALLLLTSTESALNVSFDPWLPGDFAKSITASLALRVPLALMINNNDLPVRSVADRAS